MPLCRTESNLLLNDKKNCPIIVLHNFFEASLFYILLIIFIIYLYSALSTTGRSPRQAYAYFMTNTTQLTTGSELKLHYMSVRTYHCVEFMIWCSSSFIFVALSVYVCIDIVSLSACYSVTRCAMMWCAVESFTSTSSTFDVQCLLLSISNQNAFKQNITKRLLDIYPSKILPYLDCSPFPIDFDGSWVRLRTLPQRHGDERVRYHIRC